jgi:two-component system cell cycle sensor histidine kinase/response regulator CckA
MSKPRILIVEDESVVALDIRYQLQALGYEVAGETRLAEEAEDLAVSLRPDLVLMDIHLGGQMDGIEAAGRVRARCQLPVVFLTAFAGDAVVDRAKEAQPYGYIVKPFDERELRTVIEMSLHRHAAEIRQRAADDELAAVVRTALDGYCVVDRDGRILEVNEAGCRMVGFAREALLGRSIADLAIEDSPGQTAATLARLPQDGSARLERRYRTADGRTIEVEISATYRPTLGGRIIAFFRDITARKRAESALQESLAHLRRAQEVARLGSYTLEFATGLWSASSHLDALFGIDATYPHNIEGWVALVDPEHRDEMRGYFTSHVIAGRNRFDKEYRIIRQSDGRRRWVSGLGELEFDASGQPVRMVGTIQDITARRSLEEQLRQAQKMEVVGQLAGGVAHDFNNILTAITLNLELMRLAELPGESRSSLAELESLARRAARLTQQLLMFARRKAIKLTTVEVNSALTGLVQMLRRLLGEHITLHHQPGQAPLWVEADAGMLDQAVMNLCINARDAMPHGGELTLAADRITLDEAAAAALAEARPGEFVRISVSDTGSGIPPEVLQHLFEPFFTTKDIGKGTGLGLASVHGVVHQHQGWIAVESVPGRGSTFRIFLPVSARTTSEVKPPTISSPAPKGRETVLLVEDEVIVRQVSAIALRSLGYRVFAAGDANEALRVWLEHAAEIDLLLTDMIMPGNKTGLQLAHELRARDPNLKVLIMSGYSTEIIQAETLQAQGIFFLPKPFESQQLGEALRRCLDPGRA